MPSFARPAAPLLPEPLHFGAILGATEGVDGFRGGEPRIATACET